MTPASDRSIELSLATNEIIAALEKLSRPTARKQLEIVISSLRCNVGALKQVKESQKKEERNNGALPSTKKTRTVETEISKIPKNDSERKNQFRTEEPRSVERILDADEIESLMKEVSNEIAKKYIKDVVTRFRKEAKSLKRIEDSHKKAEEGLESFLSMDKLDLAEKVLCA